MERVTGIGGIFFKSQDADSLREWYRAHLGIEIEPWGGKSFAWREHEQPGEQVGQRTRDDVEIQIARHLALVM